MMAEKQVQIRSGDGGLFNAYVAEPAGGPTAAIVLVQEMLGVTPWLKGVAGRFAGEGYCVIVPDIFWRFDPGFVGDHANKDDYERAWTYLRNLDYDLAVQDVDACANVLRDMPNCNGKIGVVGFCMGGTIAYLAAARLAIDAAIAYYGTGIHHHLDEAHKITCPLALHYGSQDHTLKPEDIDEIGRALDGKSNVRIWTYDTGHAFANSDLVTLYSRRDADHAHQRTMDILKTLI